MTDEQTREYLRSFTVLVESDDAAAVDLIPGANDAILVELTLKEFGSLQEVSPAGLIGNRLKLHFDRQKAIELARKTLALAGAGE